MEEAQRNKELIRRVLEAADRGDMAAVKACFAPDYLDHSTGGSRPTADREGAMAAFQRLAPAFPDLRHEIHHLIAEGDMVALRVTATATHTAELDGIPATGQAVSMTQTVVYRIRDGLIAERWLDKPDSVARQVEGGRSLVVRAADAPWRHDASGASFWELPLRDLSLTCFRMGPDTLFPAHSHPAEQITYVLEGRLTFEVGGERHTLGPGDAIAIPSGAPHTVSSEDEPVLAIDAWSPPPDHLGTG